LKQPSIRDGLIFQSCFIISDYWSALLYCVLSSPWLSCCTFSIPCKYGFSFCICFWGNAQWNLLLVSNIHSLLSSLRVKFLVSMNISNIRFFPPFTGLVEWTKKHHIILSIFFKQR
jgi:hypothetical protein